MPKILFLSYRWNDQRLKTHSSDAMMANAFSRAGWTIHYHDYRDYTKKHGLKSNQSKIFREIMNIKPDLLFITKGERVDPDTIRLCKRNGFKGKVIGWYNDIRKQPVKCVTEISKVCDWFFHCIGDSSLQKYYDVTQTPCSFLFAPFEPLFVLPRDFDERTYKVTHYGQLYDPRKGFDSLRRDIIPEIRDLLDDYGACFDRGFIRGVEYYGALGNSKMSISIPAIDQPFYFSNRHSHIMGSGAVALSYRFKNCLDMFADGVNIITFKNNEELRNKISYYLNNTEELKTIQVNSLNFANTYLTSDRVYEEIIHTLQHGESSYPFGQVVNPDRRKILDA